MKNNLKSPPIAPIKPLIIPWEACISPVDLANIVEGVSNELIERSNYLLDEINKLKSNSPVERNEL